jgi:hypothetical protein
MDGFFMVPRQGLGAVDLSRETEGLDPAASGQRLQIPLPPGFRASFISGAPPATREAGSFPFPLDDALPAPDMETILS